MRLAPRVWRRLTGSLWFVPGVLVSVMTVLGVSLVEVDARVSPDLGAEWPRLFGAGAEGARALLATVATSMVTIAGVAFSITLVALAQASTQYTSRVLRNYMSDRTNQVILGSFVGIFAYCLVVLRTVRGGDGAEFVPAVAVFGGVGLGFVGIVLLIYFLHHISSSLQASTILARLARDTLRVVDRCFPAVPGGAEAPARARELPAGDWHPVPARRTGYVQGVEVAALVRVAREQGIVVRMSAGVGDFVIAGRPLAAVRGDAPPDPGVAGAIARAYAVADHRSTDEDPAWGIQQLVDVALMALSPGVNDTTTAITAIDHLSAVLARLAAWPAPSPYHHAGPALRVIVVVPEYSALVARALGAIREHARGNTAVLRQLARAVERGGQEAEGPRRAVLGRQAARLLDAVQRTVEDPAARRRLGAEIRALRARLAAPPAPHPP